MKATVAKVTSPVAQQAQPAECEECEECEGGGFGDDVGLQAVLDVSRVGEEGKGGVVLSEGLIPR